MCAVNVSCGIATNTRGCMSRRIPRCLNKLLVAASSISHHEAMELTSTKVDTTSGEGSMKDGQEGLTSCSRQPSPTHQTHKIRNAVALGQNGNSHILNMSNLPAHLPHDEDGLTVVTFTLRVSHHKHMCPRTAGLCTCHKRLLMSLYQHQVNQVATPCGQYCELFFFLTKREPERHEAQSFCRVTGENCESFFCCTFAQLEAKLPARDDYPCRECLLDSNPSHPSDPGTGSVCFTHGACAHQDCFFFCVLEMRWILSCPAVVKSSRVLFPWAWSWTCQTV